MSGLGWVHPPVRHPSGTYDRAEARAAAKRPLSDAHAAAVAHQWKRTGPALQALSEGRAPVSVVFVLGDVHRVLGVTTNHLDRTVLYALVDWILDRREDGGARG